MENKRDIRLYQYSAGGLQKVGRNKTGPRPHLFESVEKCEEHRIESSSYGMCK
jgi:hypothetical protein